MCRKNQIKRKKATVMHIACFGAGEKSRKVKEILDKYTGHRVDAYVEDIVFDKIGTQIEGIDVISKDDMAERYLKDKIHGVAITTEYSKKTVQDIIKICRDYCNVRDENIFLIPINILRGKEITEPEREILVPYRELVQIYDINYHVTDHCNLNCELCCHFSSLVEDTVYAELQQFKKDLGRLACLVENVSRLSLLGGEPLLHPQLPEFLEFARKTYPYACLSVVTNGILLEQCSDAFYSTLRDNDITVSVSLYPPFHHKYDSWKELLEKQGINYHISIVDSFFKKFAEEKYFDAQEQSSLCGYCFGLCQGKVSRCIDSFFIKYLNQKFGVKLPEDSGIDIYEKELTGLQLVHRLEKPMELCKYCANIYTTTEKYKWRQIGKNVKKEDIFYQVKEEAGKE